MPGIADRYARLGSGEYRPVPLPKLQIGDRVWHYTDAHGLLGVVHGRELFATAPVGLNDETEVLYGQLLVEEVWANERGAYIHTSKQERHVNNVVHHALSADLRGRVYFVSASLDGDSVSMWQHYAQSGGYAIELNAGEVQPHEGDRITTKRRDALTPADQRSHSRPGRVELVHGGLHEHENALQIGHGTSLTRCRGSSPARARRSTATLHVPASHAFGRRRATACLNPQPGQKPQDVVELDDLKDELGDLEAEPPTA